MVTTIAPGLPDLTRSARDLFKIDSDLDVPVFSATEEHVPVLDPDYVFDRDTTLALLAGFVHNRRVMVQGRHGTGKSSHVEQGAAGLHRAARRAGVERPASGAPRGVVGGGPPGRGEAGQVGAGPGPPQVPVRGGNSRGPGGGGRPAP